MMVALENKDDIRQRWPMSSSTSSSTPTPWQDWQGLFGNLVTSWYVEASAAWAEWHPNLRSLSKDSLYDRFRELPGQQRVAARAFGLSTISTSRGSGRSSGAAGWRSHCRLPDLGKRGVRERSRRHRRRRQLASALQGQLPGLLRMEPPTRRLFPRERYRASRRSLAVFQSVLRFPRGFARSCRSYDRPRPALGCCHRQRSRGPGRQVRNRGPTGSPGHDRSQPAPGRQFDQSRHPRTDRRPHPVEQMASDQGRPSTYTLCRDFPDEDFSLFYVVLSNHATSRIANGGPDPDAAVRGFYTVEAQDHCDVPIGYKGTFKMVQRASYGPSLIDYTAAGNVTFKYGLTSAACGSFVPPTDDSLQHCYYLDSAQETWTAPQVSDERCNYFPHEAQFSYANDQGSPWGHQRSPSGAQTPLRQIYDASFGSSTKTMQVDTTALPPTNVTRTTRSRSGCPSTRSSARGVSTTLPGEVHRVVAQRVLYVRGRPHDQGHVVMGPVPHLWGLIEQEV